MSIQSDFSFLKIYPRRHEEDGSVSISKNNVFFPVEYGELEEAEQLLGYPFPSELRAFYEQIGYGYLSTPHVPPPGHHQSGNEILPPLTAARFALGIREWEGQENWISQDFIEDELKPGDLPFFEMYDSSYFMVMKPLSENPNAVWYMGRKKIEDSFETFIRNLYYDDPNYYAWKWDNSPTSSS
jgi:hypothetical protein